MRNHLTPSVSIAAWVMIVSAIVVASRLFA